MILVREGEEGLVPHPALTAAAPFSAAARTAAGRGAEARACGGCTQAGARLSEALVKWYLGHLAPGRWKPLPTDRVWILLPTLAPRLTPKAAADAAAQTLDGMLSGGQENLPQLARIFPDFAARMDREGAAALARKVRDAFGRFNVPVFRAALGHSLAALCRRLDREAGAETAFAGAIRLVEVMASPSDRLGLGEALTELAEQLDTAALVELLKHPLCVGEAREAVLTAFGKRAGRQFSDLWQLTEWLSANEPRHSLSTPARRIER